MEQGKAGRLRDLLGRLGRDQRGAIAPIAAVVITSVLIGTGAAVDISRLVTARSQLQDAVDSADLALARMPASTTDADMKTKAQAWITANLTDPNIQSVVVQTPVRSIGQVQLKVTASINTAFAGLLGLNSIPLEGHTTVNYGTTHVELALVLDNTGSMNDDSKLTSLKAASTTLINTLAASASVSGDANALKVAVVPFSMAVNVGSQYQNAAWITGKAPTAYNDAYTSGQDRFTLLNSLGMNWGGCVEDRPMPYDVQDTAPTTSVPATMFVPYFSPDEPDTGNYKYGSKTGCIDSNYGNCKSAIGTSINDYLDDGVTTTVYADAEGSIAKYKKSALYTPAPSNSYWKDTAGPNSGCTVAPILRLTTNTASALTEIASMVASGDTEIPLGLVWGWHVLSPNAPFADGTAYGKAGTIKVIVLVTDGANTYGNQSNPNGSAYTALGYAGQKRISTSGTYSGTQSALNTRLSTLCNNMKTKNPDGTWKINIYTVPLEVTDASTKTLLQGCVTDPTNYLDVASSSQLSDAFANIAGSISALRVSH